MSFFYDKNTEKAKGGRITAAIVTGLAALTLGCRSCTIIPAGYVGVQNLFGKVSQEEFYSGLSLKSPFYGVTKIDTRTKEKKETISVPTKEGLIATLDVSVLYHVNPEKAYDIVKKIGSDYESIIVEPIARNVVRDTIAKFSSEDLYSTNREQIALAAESTMKEMYQDRGIVLENVLFRDLTLPDQVTKAIESKIEAKQQSEQMEWVLAKQKKESDRLRIEAQGIADAQHTIAGSLTPAYLQWKYIDTLEKLAGSTNTTFLITPFDQKIIPMLPMK